jgi:dTDP-4-dehydrorhamnose reductase
LAEKADLTDIAGTIALLDREQPNVIVNASAYTAVDLAEDEERLATLINATAPGAVSKWARSNNSLLVHYSTDYVFPGNSKTPYSEDSETSPLGAYGRSKLAGEYAIRDSGSDHMIFRTAWVYAPRGKNFLLTMLRLAKERELLKVVSDQIGTPTTAKLIAEATTHAIGKWRDTASDHKADLLGTFHLTASGSTTWHAFAQSLLLRANELGLLQNMPTVEAIKSDQFPTPAARPTFSVLNQERFQRAFDFALPAWEEGMEHTLQALRPR